MIRWINGSDVAFSDRLLSFSSFPQTTGTSCSTIWHFLCGISNGLAFKFFLHLLFKNKRGEVYWMQTWAWIWAQESLWLSFLTVWLYSQGSHVCRRWSERSVHSLAFLWVILDSEEANERLIKCYFPIFLSWPRTLNPNWSCSLLTKNTKIFKSDFLKIKLYLSRDPLHCNYYLDSRTSSHKWSTFWRRRETGISLVWIISTFDHRHMHLVQ